MRFSQAIELYRNHLELERSKATASGYHGSLMQFCLYLRNPLITQVTPEHITEYFRGKLELGWKKNSLVVPCMAIRKFFEYWCRKGYPVLNYQLVPVVHKEGVEPRVADRDGLRKLLAICSGNDIYDKRNRAMILLFADSGMRSGELCSINTDIDTDSFSFTKRCECGFEVTLSSQLSHLVPDCQLCKECGKEISGNPTTKVTVKQFSHIIQTEKRRSSVIHRRIFWYEETNEALRAYIEQRNLFAKFFSIKHPDALFIGVKGCRPGHRMVPSTVALMLRDLSREANIETVNAHSIRHMFGVEAAEIGQDNSNISDLLGHVSLESSFVYTHLRGDKLGKAHRKVKVSPFSNRSRNAMLGTYEVNGTASKTREEQASR